MTAQISLLANQSARYIGHKPKPYNKVVLCTWNDWLMFYWGDNEAIWIRRVGPLAMQWISLLSFFSVDILAAHETLQAIVNRMINEYLQPEVNNLTPKQD